MTTLTDPKKLTEWFNLLFNVNVTISADQHVSEANIEILKLQRRRVLAICFKKLIVCVFAIQFSLFSDLYSSAVNIDIIKVLMKKSRIL